MGSGVYCLLSRGLISIGIFYIDLAIEGFCLTTSILFFPPLDGPVHVLLPSALKRHTTLGSNIPSASSKSRPLRANLHQPR